MSDISIIKIIVGMRNSFGFEKCMSTMTIIERGFSNATANNNNNTDNDYL